MYPSKNMVDYMAEINRLFSRPESENAYGLAAQSPYNSTINRSSSSADSTSPESFPDISTFQPNNYRPVPNTPTPDFTTPPPKFESPQPMYDDTPKVSKTPFLYRRQRPIVGRKILSPETQTPSFERVQVPPVAKKPEEDLVTAMWTEDPMLFQHTPPNVNNIYINNTNVFYELFPKDNKGYEFQSPLKTSPTLSSNVSNVSPTFSNISPLSPPSPRPMGPTPMYRQRSPSVNSSYGPGSSRFYHRDPSQKLCTFCRKNGETPVVYLTHWLKERVGNKHIVACPILRSHVCSMCGASGDEAHTITYCPVLRSSNNGHPIPSTTITLKNTRIKSNGRRRY